MQKDFIQKIRAELVGIAEYWNGSTMEAPAADAATIMRERALSAIELIDSYLHQKDSAELAR